MRTFIVLLLCVFLSACNYPTIRSWQHRPFHPNNNQSITFRVEGTDSDGVKSARLFIYEYELYVASNGMKSARPRAGGTWGLVHTWNVTPTPGDFELSHTLPGFPAASYIMYRFEVTNDKNRTRVREARFDAGTSPWPRNTIVLWSSSPRSPAKTIDICFVPDVDYSRQWRTYLTDLEGLIYDGYHTNNMISGHKEKYAFYYTRAEGESAGFPDWKLDLPSEASNMSHIDVFGIVHQTDFRDVRVGNRFSTEAASVGTAVHETGHAVFNLADEYCCDGGYSSVTPFGNLYTSQANCEAANAAIGQPITNCRSYTAGNGTVWWAAEPTSPACLMRVSGGATMGQFRTMCQRRINWFYQELITD